LSTTPSRPARRSIRSAAERASTFGLPAKAPGKGLSLAKLNAIVDYPARDMTITVEAG
jgi:FAD/FMN-containing dehydrogenase